MAATNDSPDLEALFDEISDSKKAEAANNSEAKTEAAPVAANSSNAKGLSGDTQDAVFNRLGQMTRTLNDTLRQLGYDKMLEKSAAALPDTKARLSYVANLTEQAANKVLNATDIAEPIVEQIEISADALSKRWEQLFNKQLDANGMRQLAIDSRNFLSDELKRKNNIVRTQLNEIMMAQDFQDLTGQVIKRIIAVAQELETSLMNVLLQVVPESKKNDKVTDLMQGPVISAEGRTDVVVNQEQVDDLLDSLGF